MPACDRANRAGVTPGELRAREPLRDRPGSPTVRRLAGSNPTTYRSLFLENTSEEGAPNRAAVAPSISLTSRSTVHRSRHQRIAGAREQAEQHGAPARQGARVEHAILAGRDVYTAQRVEALGAGSRRSRPAARSGVMMSAPSSATSKPRPRMRANSGAPGTGAGGWLPSVVPSPGDRRAGRSRSRRRVRARVHSRTPSEPATRRVPTVPMLRRKIRRVPAESAMNASSCPSAERDGVALTTSCPGGIAMLNRMVGAGRGESRACRPPAGSAPPPAADHRRQPPLAEASGR